MNKWKKCKSLGHLTHIWWVPCSVLSSGTPWSLPGAEPPCPQGLWGWTLLDLCKCAYLSFIQKLQVRDHVHISCWSLKRSKRSWVRFTTYLTPLDTFNQEVKHKSPAFRKLLILEGWVDEELFHMLTSNMSFTKRKNHRLATSITHNLEAGQIGHVSTELFIVHTLHLFLLDPSWKPCLCQKKQCKQNQRCVMQVVVHAVCTFL